MVRGDGMSVNGRVDFYEIVGNTLNGDTERSAEQCGTLQCTPLERLPQL